MKQIDVVRKRLRGIEMKMIQLLSNRNVSKEVDVKIIMEGAKGYFNKKCSRVYFTIVDGSYEIDKDILKLIVERILLGNQVAICKYPSIENELKHSSDKLILEKITHKDVEQRIVKNLMDQQNVSETVKYTMKKLMTELLFPYTKQIQISKIKKLLNK